MKICVSGRIKRSSLYIVALLLVLGVRSSPEADPEIPAISKRINAFTIDLLKYCAGVANAPANTILSAQSIFHTLAMSYIASGGETRKELAEVFHLPDDNEQLLKDLAKLRRQLHAAGKQKGIDVTVANSVWLDETYADFRREYVKEVEKVFDASLHRVKFEQRVQVSKDINKWISEKTHGRIQEGVSPRDFESRSTPGVVDEPALVCVNAVYFNAYWASQFDKTSTRKQPFHVDASTTTEMMMMHQRSLLPYSENEKVKFLEIPYIDGSYSMYVVLPKEIISIRDLAETLSAEMVVGLKRSSFVHEVDVLFPKFEMKSHLGVKDALSDIGVKLAFDKQRADFDQMIIKKFEAFRIYISEIYHDAWIDVHEEGTEAASATTTTHFSFGCSAPPRPMPAQFHANHPFLFMIIHNQSRSILFAGWISNPEAIAQQVAPADAVTRAVER